MRILLLGEYSNVHWTLAEGLRALGHEVCVVSNGDYWKHIPADILLTREYTPWATLKYAAQVLRTLPKLRGYDVVQLINPLFFELKAERIPPIYRYLRRHNKRLFMGAFGMDYYWIQACADCRTFRYSDCNIGPTLRDTEFYRKERRDWVDGAKGPLNRMIAADCDGIISCLYEYHAVYHPLFPHKEHFIPLPINLSKITPRTPHEGHRVRFFIGISKGRSEYKGTDVMERALRRVVAELPDRAEMVRAEGVPYQEYQQLINTSDVLLDQLYGYTPAMNALLAMAKGIVVVGGGEPEAYDLLGEPTLRPVVNVVPDEEQVYQQLKNLALHPEEVQRLSQESIAYVQKYHDHLQVARQYLAAWQSPLSAPKNTLLR
jgi:glycosyltransferase involved in cell wall biosynthesis